MAELSVIGISHQTAPVEVREGLALASDEAARVLAGIRAEKVFDEALLLSTCNRTEVYFVPRTDADPLTYFLDHVARVKGVRPAAGADIFYRRDDADAVRHLFRVAASLDSQIVGEHEILGQVKDAYHLAVEARTTSALLNKLTHWAFRVGKRVRTETDLGAGSASVAAAAVDLAKHIFSSLEGKTVLLVGAGQTAEAAARALLGSGADHLVVANRTLHRARQLAYDLAHETIDRAVTEAVGLDAIPETIAKADLVITSTASEEPVLTWRDLSEVLRTRRGAVLIVDIAGPRDVDARLGSLDNVYLYNIDDLDRLVRRNLERRRQDIPKAEAIVEYEVGRFGRWLASRQAAPTIRLLQQHLATIQKKHIDRYGKQFSQIDRTQLEQFTQAMCKQILHTPLALLKELSADAAPSERLAAVDLVRRLFDLDAIDDEQLG